MAAPLRQYKLTPQQIALSEERMLKRQEQAPTAPAPFDAERGRILKRERTQLEKADSIRSSSVRFMTWNLLAQCLVRRELFPTSNCLKAGQREHMIFNEILSHDADILCLQEVDRLEKLILVLDKAGYNHVYAAGPRKNHGCLIGYRRKSYTLVDHRFIHYDDQEIREGSNDRSRRGSSFKTKNIASFVALRKTDSESNGFIVATTHLFWHPRYTYERARQAVVLLREVKKFQMDNSSGLWPCIISGDFNFAPDDPAYSLLVGDPLLPVQEERLSISRVVHCSVDSSIPIIAKGEQTEDDQEGGSEADPDKVITNARPANSQDGLLSTLELVQLIADIGHLRSAYDEGQKKHPELSTIFGSRVPIPAPRHGAHEPEWTSYTHYWKTVLDYIFILDPPDRHATVTGFLRPHSTTNLHPGLPKLGVCGSDHVSLSADIRWSPVEHQLDPT